MKSSKELVEDEGEIIETYSVTNNEIVDKDFTQPLLPLKKFKKTSLEDFKYK